MNLDKVEDFDIAVKLKEIMNVLESKNEIINIALAAIDRKHAKRDEANNINYINQYIRYVITI